MEFHSESESESPFLGKSEINRNAIFVCLKRNCKETPCSPAVPVLGHVPCSVFIVAFECINQIAGYMCISLLMCSILKPFVCPI